MDSSAWFDYFTRNQRADGHIERVCGTALDPDLRRELALSLARFQLGEASGGRIAEEVETARDPALDLHNRRAIQFYVLEEARHARELAALVLALGGTTLTQHWSSDWFRRVRRCLGLRTKMLTMAAAEVVGIVYYTLLRERVACSTVERTLALIAREETRHLNFQAEWFAGAVAHAWWPLRPLLAFGIVLRFSVISCAAVLFLLADHRHLLARLKVTPLDFVRLSAREVSRRFPLLQERHHAVRVQ